MPCIEKREGLDTQLGRVRCRGGGTRKCWSHSMNMARLDAAVDRGLDEGIHAHALPDDAAKGTRQRQKPSGNRTTAAATVSKAGKFAAKRLRIIDGAFEGVITKADRDRRLQNVDDEVEANRRALAELLETPMPTYAEWKELFRPCAGSERGLSSKSKN